MSWHKTRQSCSGYVCVPVHVCVYGLWHAVTTMFAPVLLRYAVLLLWCFVIVVAAIDVACLAVRSCPMQMEMLFLSGC